jgi:hypothetical protein
VGAEDVYFGLLGVVEQRLDDVEEEAEPARHVEDEHFVTALRVVRRGHVHHAFDDGHHL